MESEDLLISRLRLLIIMSKAYLKGYPLGDFRRHAIGQTSRRLFYEALTCSGKGKMSISCHKAPAGHIDQPSRHNFLLRTQLLAVMLNAATRGKAEGNFRNRAMAENIDQLGKYMAERVQIGDAAFLKVA